MEDPDMFVQFLNTKIDKSRNNLRKIDKQEKNMSNLTKQEMQNLENKGAIEQKLEKFLNIKKMYINVMKRGQRVEQPSLQPESR